MAIKMICSDIDGTLLQYGRKKLEGEIFDQIRALHDRGILFCPASGRQYTSLRLLFAPVADCCVFLCENGGVLFKDEHCIAENPMPRALAEEIAHDLWDRSDGQGEVMLSGQNCAYLMERGLGMLDRIQFIGNRYKVISDPSEIPEEIVKVSVYLHEGVEKYADRFVPRWQQANCAVAGPYWIDTTTANKGVGVECSAACWASPMTRSWPSATTTTMWRCLTLSARLTSWTVPPRRCAHATRCTRPARRMCCGNFSGNDDSTHLWTNRTHSTQFFIRNNQRFSSFLELFPLTLAAEYVIIITA